MALFLSGCETFLGKKSKDPLPGDRQQVLLTFEDIKVDPQVGHLYVGLPDAVNHMSWEMSGGNARHALEPGLLNSKIQEVWRRDIGTGLGNFYSVFDSRSFRLLNGPVSAENRVFTVDAEGTVCATDLQTGQALWRTETISVTERSQPFSGGVVYNQGRVFVSTANAEVVALDASKGSILWRAPTTGPVRAAPTVKDGRVFVVTINNQLEVFEAAAGKLLWTHTGMMESAGLLGGPSPAVHEGVVVVTYSSGEIFALRVENGYPLWSESLGQSQKLDSVSALTHIKARPIIDRNLVFLLSHNGHMSALDLRQGQTIWSKNIGGIRTPAITGDYLFVVTNENQVLCLKRETGQVLWVQKLPWYVDEKTRTERILWAGPIIVNNQLVFAGSHGKALFLFADSGKQASIFDLPGKTSLSPILVNKTLLFLTDDATLVAFR